MQPFDFAADLGIREDLPHAYRKAWQIIAQPGNWWTAQQRVDIARESRAAKDCRLCQARKSALSPNAVQGEHDSVSDLPKPAIDAIHRVMTDASRLSAVEMRY